MGHKSSDAWRTLQLAMASAGFLTLVGCASLPWQDQERTSIITPRMRVSAVQEMGARGRDAEAEEQLRLTQQLATQIQSEPDPLVRHAIQEAIGQFSTPLAGEVLKAGLGDEDLDVRLACCEWLGQRNDPAMVGVLRGVLEKDENLDVRLAAIDALGQIQSTASVAALAAAVNDRDPALQYAGVEALKSLSGQDLGNDVAAWRAYASSEQPEISVAKRPGSWSPF